MPKKLVLADTETGEFDGVVKDQLNAAYVAINPSEVRAAWGHSLAAGNTGGSTPWTTPLAVLLGKTVTNRGIGGQTIAQIASRQGGLRALVESATGQVPASGPVTVTITPTLGATITGSLLTPDGEIAGTLTTTTFTRTAAGDVIDIPAGARFIPDAAYSLRDAVTYLWPSRNDSSTAVAHEDVVERIAKFIAYLTPAQRRVLIFEDPPTTSDTIGTTARDAWDARNAAIRSAFPDMYVPIMTWLRTYEAAAAVGVVFTPADLDAIADGVTPPTFLTDTIHPNTIANVAIARRVYDEEVARGWVLPTQDLIPAATYISDDFARADGALGNTTGGEWPWASSQGTAMVITSGQAAPGVGQSGSTLMTITYPETDGELSVELPVVPGSGDLWGMYFRGNSSNVGYVLYAENGNIRLRKKTGASAYTTLWTDTYVGAAGDVLAARFEGSSITVLLNGVELTTVVDATYTGDRVGLFVYDSDQNARFDNFEFKALV